LSYIKENPDKAPSPPAESALMAASNYLFNFSNIQTSGESGQVLVEVYAKNFPGYRDTHFQIPILKYDTTTNSTVKLGRSADRGRISIMPGDTDYYNENGPVYGSRIDFMTGGTTDGVPSVTIEEHYGLNIYGSLPTSDSTEAAGLPSTQGDFSKTGQPVRVRQADVLIEDGRLGIGNVPADMLSGDFTNPSNPSAPNGMNEKLRVNGDSYFSGNVNVQNDLTIGGNISVEGEVEVKGQLNMDGETAVTGNLMVDGTVSDQYGRLVPVGTLSMITPAEAISADPDGWLICDGRDLTSLMVNDMSAGTKTDPGYISKYWNLFKFLAQGMSVAEASSWSGPSVNLNNATGLIIRNGGCYFTFPGSGNISQMAINGNYHVYLPQFSGPSQLKPGSNVTTGDSFSMPANWETVVNLGTVSQAISMVHAGNGSSNVVDGYYTGSLTAQQVYDNCAVPNYGNALQFIIKY